MQDRIDPLIAERAPWLFTGQPHHELARKALTRALGYPETLRLATALEHEATPRIMEIVADRILRDVEATGLENLPRNGPLLVVANHPTGIADGILLHKLLSPLRPDLFFYANSDILRVLPQMTDLIAPVEWRHDKRSHSKTRETMDYTRRAIDEGRAGVIFPSGRLAKRRGLRLHERRVLPGDGHRRLRDGWRRADRGVRVARGAARARRRASPPLDDFVRPARGPPVSGA